MESNTEERIESSKPVIGITIGDINGIGPEIIIKTLRDQRILNLMTPVVLGSSKTLSYYRKSLHLEDFSFTQVKEDGHINPKQVNVLNCWEEAVEISSGKVTDAAGRCARLALQKASEMLGSNALQAIVTAPVNKSNLFGENFNFKGHTDFFEKYHGGTSLMTMISNDLIVGLVTDHIPLRHVPEAITKERLTSKLKIFLKSLRFDMGIAKPRIAVLGLNPHAGENGLLGTEEKEVIEPVIADFKSSGKLVFGPFPADGFFGSHSYSAYDGVLGMYHDQVLAPFKSLSFDSGVNFSAGLEVVRTSPDHGTANTIAGKNMASESSFRNALFRAHEILRNRTEYQPQG